MIKQYYMVYNNGFSIEKTLMSLGIAADIEMVILKDFYLKMQEINKIV